MFAYFCVEDPLSRAIIRRLIRDLVGDIHLIELLPNQGGFSSMKLKFGEYCTLAQHHSVFILTDLDDAECAPRLRSEWANNVGLAKSLPEKLYFRVAEKEVEAWLLADRNNLCDYLGIPYDIIPEDEIFSNPKEFFLNCVKQHGDATAKYELLPEGNARVGLGYNSYLTRFAAENWDFQGAAFRNLSLGRAVQRIAAARQIEV